MKLATTIATLGLSMVLAGGAFAQEKQQLAFVVNAASDFGNWQKPGSRQHRQNYPGMSCNSGILHRERQPCRMR